MVEVVGAKNFAPAKEPRRAALRPRNAAATAPQIKCDATRRAARRCALHRTDNARTMTTPPKLPSKRRNWKASCAVRKRERLERAPDRAAPLGQQARRADGRAVRRDGGERAEPSAVQLGRDRSEERRV